MFSTEYYRIIKQFQKNNQFLKKLGNHPINIPLLGINICASDTIIVKFFIAHNGTVSEFQITLVLVSL